ncbi:MAG TPA: chemotaxis protein CheW [Stellaceae bacterium]|nr:chemotaxis protein CheW [Stellaceae bacterium]
MHGTFVVFRVGPYRLGVPLDRVERVVAAVAVAPLPDAPEIVLGIVDIARDIVPVCDVHRRLGVARGPVAATDRFVVARSARRRLVLAADEVIGVAALAPDEGGAPAARVPVPPHLCGVAAAPDGIVLIEDLDRFLSLDEEGRLAAAIDHQGQGDGGSAAGASA